MDKKNISKKRISRDIQGKIRKLRLNRKKYIIVDLNKEKN